MKHLLQTWKMTLFFMRCKWLICGVVLVSILFSPVVNAENSNARSVTLIYEAANDQQLKDVQLIEANLSAFFERVELIPLTEISDIAFTTDVIVGYSQEELPATFPVLTKHLLHYEGNILALGQFYQYLPQELVKPALNEVAVHSIDELALSKLITVKQVSVIDGSKILAKASGFNEEIPLIVQRGNQIAYIATDFQVFEIQILLNSLLNSLYPGNQGHPAYIVIENINPLTDVKKLEKVVAELSKNWIPVILSVAPIYVMSETGESATLSQAKELVELLQQLQKQGAQIIVDSHLEEVTPTASEQHLQPEKTEGQDTNSVSNFATAVQLFIQENIYPSSVYTEKYGALQESYDQIAKHTSSFIGKLPLSAANMDEEVTPFFISKPQLLGGQTFYPLTLGDLQFQYQDQFIMLKKQIEQLKQVDGAVLSTSFSMYEEVAQLSNLIELFEKVPSLYWYDFNKDSFSIQTEKFSLTQKAGAFEVESNWTWQDELKWTFRDRPLEIVLWLLIVLPIVFVAIFTLNIFIMRMRYRKNLFEERS